MKNIALLGSTGSIGTQTLDVVSHLEGFFKIRSLAAGKNIALLSEQAEKFSPERISVADEKDAKMLRKKFLDVEIIKATFVNVAFVNIRLYYLTILQFPIGQTSEQ